MYSFGATTACSTKTSYLLNVSLVSARLNKNCDSLVLSIYIRSHYTNKAELIVNSSEGKLMLISLLFSVVFKQGDKSLHFDLLIVDGQYPITQMEIIFIDYSSFAVSIDSNHAQN